jgi:putative glycosyltransferase (TIGR04372 family)
MFKRKFLIIENWLLDQLIRGTWLGRTAFYHVSLNKMHEFNINEYFEFNNFKPTLSFSRAEEERGKYLLNKMGIKANDWFVCFHARDNSYLNETTSRNNYRNCDIDTFMKAAEYIVSVGGFAIRMGAKVEKPLPKNRSKRIIDYAVEFRSDFMDIYLSTHCKFFLGSATGLFNVPSIFDVPVVCANHGPFEYTPFRRGDLHIPKLYFDRHKGVLLSFQDILDSGLGRSMINTGDNREDGIVLVDNTAEEIYEVVREMNQRLDGRYTEASKDVEDQKRFQSLFKPEHVCYGSPAKIGADFLRKYRLLLENSIERPDLKLALTNDNRERAR